MNYLDILKGILHDKTQRTGLITQFQDHIWDLSEEIPLFDELGTLAHDLDFYEPNDEWRRESSSYYDDERLEQLLGEFISEYGDRLKEGHK